MILASIIDQFRQPFLDKYGHRLLPGQLKALDAITACKKACGHFSCRCNTCKHLQHHALSCGHRHCPKCQHHAATRWLERQKQKLIPCEYFMVTFTLPEQLRSLVYQHQHRLYDLLFTTSIDTLTTLCQDTRHLGGDPGMTAVLHTHTRRLDFHPHLHVVIPAAALHNMGRSFKRVTEPFFIHGNVIAKMFRGKFVYALLNEGFILPAGIPEKWVVNVKHIGRGLPALQYLSRYLYRGVINEKAIIDCNNQTVTFQYRDSQTQTRQTRTLPGEEFIWKVLTHVLPRAFRRVRDYGFLHHNAKRKLTFIQYLLQVKLPGNIPQKKPVILCQQCLSETSIVGIYPQRIPINFRFMRSDKVKNE